MKTSEYLVPNISCGHCVHTIQTELGDLEGVNVVVASQDTKQVKVSYDDPATEAGIVDLLKEINYPPA